MPVLDDDFPIAIHQAVNPAAGLRALAAIAAAPANRVAHQTLPAVTNAQRAVNERLQFNRRRLANVFDLIQAQLARQDRTTEAHRFEERHPFGRVVVHLRAGDQRNRRQIALQQPHILDNQPVHADVV
mgnify:CR=1 FL=1